MRKVIIIFILLGCPFVYGNEIVSEESLKAAFIFNFLKFVDWQDSRPTYDICIPEDENLRKVATALLRGKTLNDRQIEVVDRIGNCHVLVASNFLNPGATLTIGPLTQGAMFEFMVVDNKLKFAINIDNIRKSKLKISSQLLNLAVPPRTIDG
jgi:hypothetical protein